MPNLVSKLDDRTLRSVLSSLHRTSCLGLLVLAHWLCTRFKASKPHTTIQGSMACQNLTSGPWTECLLCIQCLPSFVSALELFHFSAPACEGSWRG